MTRYDRKIKLQLFQVIVSALKLLLPFFGLSTIAALASSVMNGAVSGGLMADCDMLVLV